MSISSDEFEDYLADERLVYIYDALKSVGVQVIPIPPSARIPSEAMCETDHIGGKNFSVSVKNNPYASQTIICHELMHIALYCQGFPIIKTVNATPEQQRIIEAVANFTTHIFVWELMKRLGYSDADRHTVEIQEVFPQYELSLVSHWQICKNIQCQHDLLCARRHLIRACIDIAHMISCPSESRQKKILIHQLQAFPPPSVELVVEFLSLYRKSVEVADELPRYALCRLLDLLSYPKEILRLCYIEDCDLRILEAENLLL